SHRDSGATSIHYAYGMGLVSQVDGKEGASYYDFDSLGSTTEMTDAQGRITSRYDYLPFGDVVVPPSGAMTPFNFVGRLGVMQAAAGLYHMRARDYVAAIGQFQTADPLGLAGGDWNTRRYVHNNPVSLSDASGLDPSALGTLIS